MRQSLIALIRVEDLATVRAATQQAGLPNTNYGWEAVCCPIGATEPTHRSIHIRATQAERDMLAAIPEVQIVGYGTRDDAGRVLTNREHYEYALAAVGMEPFRGDDPLAGG